MPFPPAPDKRPTQSRAVGPPPSQRVADRSPTPVNSLPRDSRQPDVRSSPRRSSGRSGRLGGRARGAGVHRRGGQASQLGSRHGSAARLRRVARLGGSQAKGAPAMGAVRTRRSPVIHLAQGKRLTLRWMRVDESSPCCRFSAVWDISSESELQVAFPRSSVLPSAARDASH
jgi:hypothetical protein